MGYLFLVAVSLGVIELVVQAVTAALPLVPRVSPADSLLRLLGWDSVVLDFSIPAKAIIFGALVTVAFALLKRWRP